MSQPHYISLMKTFIMYSNIYKNWQNTSPIYVKDFPMSYKNKSLNEQDLLPQILICKRQLYFPSQANFSCKKQIR